MIHHAVPMPHPSHIKAGIDGFARREMRELNTEMTKSVHKLSAESSSHSPDLIYLFNPDVNQHLARINPGDTLIIHAEGNPFVISPGFSDTPYCLTAGDLAQHLVDHNLPNIEITIKILACNSGSQVEGRTFAQDLSQALYYLHAFKKVIVEGYNGFIIVKKNSKYSASSLSNNSTLSNYSSRVSKTISKGTHSSIDDVSCAYKKGRVLRKPQRILIENTDNPFCYLDSRDRADMRYLEKTHEYREQSHLEKSRKKILKFSLEDSEVANANTMFQTFCSVRPALQVDCNSNIAARYSPNLLIMSPRNRSNSRNSPFMDGSVRS